MRNSHKIFVILALTVILLLLPYEQVKAETLEYITIEGLSLPSSISYDGSRYLYIIDRNTIIQIDKNLRNYTWYTDILPGAGFYSQCFDDEGNILLPGGQNIHLFNTTSGQFSIVYNGLASHLGIFYKDGYIYAGCVDTIIKINKTTLIKEDTISLEGFTPQQYSVDVLDENILWVSFNHGGTDSSAYNGVFKINSSSFEIIDKICLGETTEPNVNLMKAYGITNDLTYVYVAEANSMGQNESVTATISMINKLSKEVKKIELFTRINDPNLECPKSVILDKFGNLWWAGYGGDLARSIFGCYNIGVNKSWGCDSDYRYFMTEVSNENSAIWFNGKLELQISGSGYITTQEDNVITLMNNTIRSADVNNDRKVEGKDNAIVAKAYDTIPGQPRWDSRADINVDGHVEGKDVAIVAKYYDTKL